MNTGVQPEPGTAQGHLGVIPRGIPEGQISHKYRSSCKTCAVAAGNIPTMGERKDYSNARTHPCHSQLKIRHLKVSLGLNFLLW